MPAAGMLQQAIVPAHGQLLLKPEPCVLQYCEQKENEHFATEFCKSMTYFTQHSLEGGQLTLKVRTGQCLRCCHCGTSMCTRLAAYLTTAGTCLAEHHYSSSESSAAVGCRWDVKYPHILCSMKQRSVSSCSYQPLVTFPHVNGTKAQLSWLLHHRVTVLYLGIITIGGQLCGPFCRTHID